MPTQRRTLLLSLLVACWSGSHWVACNPHTKPYIALRTDPYDAQSRLEFPPDTTVSLVRKFDSGSSSSSAECPLQFSLGISKRWHHDPSSALAIRQAPLIRQVFPAAGPGRSVIYTTLYEHVDLLSPAPPTVDADNNILREALLQNPAFPWLYESSAFHASPIVHDVNADGIPDIILADYDGGIYIRGLYSKAESQPYTHHAQVPRLYVRRQWVEGRVQEVVGPRKSESASNITDHHNEADPYHSYFEYYYHDEHKENVIRGMTAHHLGHDSEDAAALKERRKRRVSHERLAATATSDPVTGDVTDAYHHAEDSVPWDGAARQEAVHEQDGSKFEAAVDDAITHRRLEEVLPPELEPDVLRYDDVAERTGDDMMMADDLKGMPMDDDFDRYDMEEQGRIVGDDIGYGDPMIDDAYRNNYDDFYGMHYGEKRNDYYDEKHYIRIPPHILCTPVVAELPRPYGDKNEKDDVLLVAVSYYFDEDEYEGHRSYKRFTATDVGDETEVKRGQYVASAILGYNLGDFGRWGSQTHLDLSTDFSAPENATMVGEIPIQEDVTHMGAFALSSPTVADIDGDGNYEVLLGTSMGYIYALEARNLFMKNFWPVQMPFPVESQILVEDVIGNTNLEIFAADVGGNIVCLSHDGKVLWSRNIVHSLKEKVLLHMSPLMLGDVDGDGSLDIVTSVQINSRVFVFAINAVTGKDLANFPLSVELSSENFELTRSSTNIPAPLLVDLHEEQSFLLRYIRRNGTAYRRPTPSRDAPSLHGGRASGLHIVQPIGEELYIIEGGSGCSHQISIGDKVSAMVQVEDVHGTGKLDLVIATESGNTITLESQAPYHPLNTWGGGLTQIRGTFAHGYSASQGIYVHEVSRQYVDIFGIYIPITFEIFDNRPGVASEPDKRKYLVEVRDGSSSKRALFRAEYTSTGVFTERVYNRFGPGYYTLSVLMLTSNGLLYEDSFAIAYNVHYLNGFGVLLWLPLCIASVTIILCGAKRSNWNDEDDDDNARENASLGILGRSLPT